VQEYVLARQVGQRLTEPDVQRGHRLGVQGIHVAEVGIRFVQTVVEPSARHLE
jgi:hypothetical protein